MITISELTHLEQLIEKIDVAFVIKICVEFILFIAFLKIVKKALEIVFNKIVSKIDDCEIKRHYSTIKFLCVSVLNVVVTLFFVTNILGSFGIDMKPILATAGVFGVAIGFGGKRFVEDIISGLMILLSGQVRVGDHITVGDSSGVVEKVNLAMIKLRATNGDVHFVRNGLVEKVINHTRDFSRPIVDIPVSYDSDILHVIDVLKGLNKDIMNNPDYGPYILDEPEIFAINSFDESSIGLRVRFKTTTMQQWAVQRYYRIMVKQKFDELKISIPFNQLDVHIQKIEN